jgi:hypothetical protein
MVAPLLLGACQVDSTVSRTTPNPPAPAKRAYHPAPGTLTGYGATDAAWNATHRADTSAAPGSAYDKDPAVMRGGDPRHNARYYGVSHDGGRVSAYSVRFPQDTSVAEARSSVLASEFPRRTRTVSFRQLDSCALLVVRSSKLSALTLRGEVTVEFTSGDDSLSYSPSDVWGAIVTPGRLTEC